MSVHTLVNKATDPRNQIEDWDTILQLCDMIVQQPDETCKNLCDAIYQRLSADHPKSRYYAVSLLDACVKNGGRFFEESLMRNRNVAGVNLIIKNDSDSDVREKWQEVVNDWEKNHPNLYQTLVLLAPSPFATNSNTSTMSSSRQVPAETTMSREDKLSKLISEITVVDDTCALMNSFVDQSESPEAMQTDEAIQQVYVNLLEIRRRLRVLIEKIPSEEVLLKSLEAHDNVNDTLDRYNEYVRNNNKLPVKQREQQQQQQQPQQQQQNLLDDFDLFITPTNQKGKATATSGDMLSLDDLFSSQPSQSPSYTPPASSNSNSGGGSFSLDNIALELNNVNQQQQQQPQPDQNDEISSGFAALARRRARKNEQEPNPFLDSPNNNTILFDQQPAYTQQQQQQKSPQQDNPFF